MSETVQNAIAVEPGGKINPRIILLALGMFALGTDAFVIAGVLPVIAHDTHVTEGMAGQLVTAFALTYGLGSPILAGLASRWSPNRVLVGALGLFCLSNIASALAPTFPLLLLTRILTGCFAATYAPLAYSTGVSLAPAAKRGQALALVAIGLTVATALGSPLGTWVGEHFSWRMSFVLIAGLAGVAFLALLFVGLPKAATPPRLSLRARLAPVTQPRLVLALLPALLWYLGYYVVYTYIAPFLQQNLKIVDISGLLIAFGLGVVIGSWSGGKLADRFGSRRPLLISVGGVMILEAILSLTTHTLFGSLVMLFVFGLVGAIIFIPQQYRLLSLAPEHANVILALNNSTFYLGVAGGAALGAVALRSIAVTQLGWVGAACTFLALLLFILSTRLSKRRAAEHEQHYQDAPSLEPQEMAIH